MPNKEINSEKTIVIAATIIGFLTIAVGFILIFSMFYFGNAPTGTNSDNSLDKLLKSDGVRMYDSNTLTPIIQNNNKK
jgi:hypothetical protein